MSKKKVKQRSGNAFLKKMRKKTEYKIKQQEALEEQHKAKEKHRLETEGCEIMYISTLHPDYSKKETKVFVGEEHDGGVVVKSFYRFREDWFLINKDYLVTEEKLNKELEEKRIRQSQAPLHGNVGVYPFIMAAMVMASSQMHGHRRL